MATHTRTGAPALTVADRSRLERQAQLLAGASIICSVVEAIVAVTAGIVAGSVAPVGFGLDSMVDVQIRPEIRLNRLAEIWLAHLADEGRIEVSTLNQYRRTCTGPCYRNSAACSYASSPPAASTSS